jgi:hypothetical protein
MTASNILVLGAGELGLAMLLSLAAQKPADTSLTVLLRPSTIKSPSPSKADEISKLTSIGVTLLPGDIGSSTVEELAAIFSPYRTIISCTGFTAGPGSQLKICNAVLSAGISRYLPWQFGVDYDIIGRGSAQDLFDEQLDVRDLLRSQTKTEWIIISTGMFTSFLFEKSFGVVDLTAENGKVVVRGLGGWKNRVTVTSPEDIAKLTAEVVITEPRIRNEIVFVAGQTVSYQELATLVEEILGKGVVREEWTVSLMREWLARSPEDFIQKYRVVFAEGKGVAWPIEETWNLKRGLYVEDVREWMMKNLLKSQ